MGALGKAKGMSAHQNQQQGVPNLMAGSARPLQYTLLEAGELRLPKGRSSMRGRACQSHMGASQVQTPQETLNTQTASVGDVRCANKGGVDAGLVHQGQFDDVGRLEHLVQSMCDAIAAGRRRAVSALGKEAGQRYWPHFCSHFCSVT